MITTILIDTFESSSDHLSRSDRAAVERAVRNCDESVVVCSISGNETAIRFALAAGADRLIRLQEIQTGLIVCGVGGMGIKGEQTAARLAIKHQAHLVLDVLEFSRQGEQLQVTRQLVRGEKERMSIKLPAVLVMAEGATTTRYVSRYRQRQVGVGSMSSNSIQERSKRADEPAWEPVRPRTKTTGLADKTAGQANQRMFAAFGISDVAAGRNSVDEDTAFTEPIECATHLIRYLAHHGFLGVAMASDAEQATLSEPLRTSGALDPLTPRPSTQRGRGEHDSVGTGTHMAKNQLLGSQPTYLTRCVPMPMILSHEQFAMRRARLPRPLQPFDQSCLGQRRLDAMTLAKHFRQPRVLRVAASPSARGPFPYRPKTG